MSLISWMEQVIEVAYLNRIIWTLLDGVLRDHDIDKLP